MNHFGYAAVVLAGLGEKRLASGASCRGTAVVGIGLAAVAQLVERVLGKDEVTGPSPVSSSVGKRISWYVAAISVNIRMVMSR